MAMDYNYTVKVFCDAIEMGFRTVDSIPSEFRDDVKRELDNRSWKKSSNVIQLENH